MRGFVSTGKILDPTYYTEDYFNQSALGRVVCDALKALMPMCSTSDLKWNDWYGIVTDWLPNNPASFAEIEAHLLSDEWFTKYSSFIMYIVPNEATPKWQMVLYYDINEDSLEMFADCRVGFEAQPPKAVSEKLPALGFTKHIA